MINIFGKDVETRKYACKENGQKAEKVNPYINVYIRLVGCNARCKFCYIDEETLNSNPLTFDIDKYELILKEFVDKDIKVNKLSFTGGEPTLNLDLLERLMRMTIEYLPHVYITVNTNGKKLLEFMDNEYFVENTNSLSLSRHHYDDKLNNEIFGMKTIPNDILKEVKLKDKYNSFHMNCNIIKGYIDNEEEIYKFLEFSSETGINSVGFSALMGVNDFCDENVIDFKNMNLINDRFNLIKTRECPTACECKNYIYIPKEINNLVKVYHKYTYNSNNSPDGLTYDGKNLIIGYGKGIVF